MGGSDVRTGSKHATYGAKDFKAATEGKRNNVIPKGLSSEDRHKITFRDSNADRRQLQNQSVSKSKSQKDRGERDTN